jgi:hypothetical protein
MYSVSVDAHYCKPIALPQIIREINENLLVTEDINDN